MASEGAHGIGLEQGFYGNERFELSTCLGEGAYGVVYQAYDRLHGAHVALKVLRHLGPDTIFYFKQEFRALADLDHPNLVHYRELFEDQGRWFLTMDLVHGEPLVRYVRGPRGFGPLDARQQERLRQALSGVAAGLRALHAAGKIHRDVKPSNLSVDEQGRVVLLDFGLVTDHDAQQSVRAPAAGTATYMAPEQIDSAHVGSEADWYAVGAMLYECLTGRAPFVGEPLAVLRHKQVERPRPPSALVDHVPPDLEQVCMGLLETQPEARQATIASFEHRVAAASSASLPLLPRGPHRDFVGREEDLCTLTRMVLDPAAPRLTVAYVHGDTGLGKTALLQALQRRMEQSHPEVLWLFGRCYEREAVPYKALDGVLDELAHTLCELPIEQSRALLPRGAEQLVRAFPVFGRVRAIERAPTRGGVGTSRGARSRAFEVLRELVARVGAHRRLVIAVDDLHWADADSLALLEALFCTSAPPPCMLLMAGRTRPLASEPVAHLVERLHGTAQLGVQLKLTPLRHSDAYRLALRSLRGRADASALADTIARESGGHPLFVDALVRHALHGPVQAPVSLEAALRSVYQTLSDDARALCQILALSSVPLIREAARVAARLSWASLSRALRDLAQLGWVRTLRTEGQVWVELCHDRVRALLASILSERQRAERHWEVARALVEQDADPEAIAIHFAEAGDGDRACRYAVSGAEAASRAFAFAHAERLYLLALSHVPDTQPARRRELRRKLAHAHLLAGRGRQAGDLYAELARKAWSAEALELRYLAARAWLDAGHADEGLPWLMDLLSDLGVRIDTGGLSGRVWRWTEKLAVATRRGSFQLRDPDQIGSHERLIADALWTLACASMWSAPAMAGDIQLRQLGYALDLGDPYRLCRAFALHAWMHQSWRGGEPLLASEELALARRLSKLTDEPHAHALLELAHGLGEVLEERYEQAAKRLSETDRLLREECIGVRWERTHAKLSMALCAYHTGQWRALQRSVDASLRDAAVCEDAFAELWRLRLGHVPHLLRGNPEAALAELEASSVGWRRAQVCAVLDAHAVLSQVEVALYRNDAEVFDVLVARWPELERAGHLASRIVRLRAYALRARAALCSARLRSDRRAELLSEAERMARLVEREGGLASPARVALIRAARLELQGQHAQARDGYRRAAALSETAGLAPLVAVADGRRGALTEGEDGRALQRQAHAWLRGAGATDAARMAAVFNGF